ncbi:MAG: type I-E CRISPR-associated endoribonuclease Cas2e [Dehalococcoidia bacterium]
MLEPRTGVFLGNPSARVRDELWERSIKTSKGDGSILQLWTDKNPQGFSFRHTGSSEREMIDFEGLQLVRISRRASSSDQNADTEK